MAGQVVIVTGAGRGQGAEEARLLAAEGAAVVVCDVLEPEGEAVAAEILAGGGAARFVRLDVADPASWDGCAHAALAWQGRISGLVNNAGIINRSGVLATTPEAWQRLLSVNLSGAFLGIRRIAPLIAESGGGAIVNTASVAGRIGHDDVAYTASKAGLLGLTRSAAAELAALNIRVNAICPGIVVTGLNAGGAHLEAWRALTPAHRFGGAAEIAKLVLFLLSDEARFITGEDIAIDGGLLSGGLITAVRNHIRRATAGDASQSTGLEDEIRDSEKSGAPTER